MSLALAPSSVAFPPTLQSSDLTRFTTWGNGVSVGRLVGEVSSLPGRAIEAIGSSCRKVNWLPISAAGALIENIGSAARAIGQLAGSIITLLERLSLNILNTLGGIGLATIGVFAAPVSTSLFNSGIKWIKDSWVSRENNQNNLSPDCPERQKAIEVCEDICFFQQSFSSTDARIKNKIPSDIPVRWKSAYHVDSQNHYIGELKNVFPVSVEVRWKNDGNIHIMFRGAENIKAFSSAITSLLGIEDATLRNARKLVQDFTALHPGKVQVSGFSFGGTLAQYAGISAGVPVTCFNSLALSPALIDKMIDWDRANLDKIKQAKVKHFNAKDDWVAQGLQSSYFLKWLNVHQLGQRYIVPEAYSRNIQNCDDEYNIAQDSHNAEHMYCALKNESFEQYYSFE